MKQDAVHYFDILLELGLIILIWVEQQQKDDYRGKVSIRSLRGSNTN